MKHSIYATVSLLLLATFGGASAAEIEMQISKRYLNFPISHRVGRTHVELSAPGVDKLPSNLLIADGEPDYWTFLDMGRYRGKKIKLTFPDGTRGMDRIYQADTIHGESEIYNEVNRPDYHFTSRRGWINDPNGMIYNDGEYHLFFQYNPFDRDSDNKAWGHAVSTDMMHWVELPEALLPDTMGTMWSGSAVMDPANDSGFGKGGKTPMVAAYTVEDGRGQRQCIAYSLDGGRTFTKYEGNPVIDSGPEWNSVDTRDPRLLRYDDHWVMVLCERDGHSIFISKNLRDWTRTDHVTGFWECPELFELAVDGDPNHKLWVMYGASGTYMLGNFDGYKFTPVSGKHRYSIGSNYAAQTFSNMPENDGRRIQMGWSRQNQPGMPFNGMILLPLELQLRTTKEGPRLTANPVSEAESICAPIGKWSNLTQAEAEEVMRPYTGARTLRLRATLELSHATDAGISLAGQRLVDYDMNGNTLNGSFYSPQNPESMEITVDVWLDRTSAEVFVDGGLLNCSMERWIPGADAEGFRFFGNRVNVKNLELWTVGKVWNKS